MTHSLSLAMVTAVIVVIIMIIDISGQSKPCAHSFSFSPQPRILVVKHSHKSLKKYLNMHFEEATIGNSALTAASLNRERYIASNRFAVRKDQGPKFEKRWADRKSRLAKLDGFRFFSLLKRVECYGVQYEKDLGNYISFTIWEDKPYFDEWRTGEAFKEAHGGGGITDFIQLLSTALFILKGSPKPAFYDALGVAIGSESLDFATDSGWRQVPADGVNYLPTDVFVVQTKYTIPDTQTERFESEIKANGQKGISGYVGLAGAFTMRRDATKADDGHNYIETSIWRSREAYDAYRTSESFAVTGFAARRSFAFYEGKLALNSPAGI